VTLQQKQVLLGLFVQCTHVACHVPCLFFLMRLLNVRWFYQAQRRRSSFLRRALPMGIDTQERVKVGLCSPCKGKTPCPSPDGSILWSWASRCDDYHVSLCHFYSNPVHLQYQILHTSAFAFNCRVLETMLHRSFHASRNRLWVKVGAGSYYLSEAALQVCRVRRCAQCSHPHSVATGTAGQQQD
jgi:hypothetical protein